MQQLKLRTKTAKKNLKQPSLEQSVHVYVWVKVGATVRGRSELLIETRLLVHLYNYYVLLLLRQTRLFKIKIPLKHRSFKWRRVSFFFSLYLRTTAPKRQSTIILLIKFSCVRVLHSMK